MSMCLASLREGSYLLLLCGQSKNLQLSVCAVCRIPLTQLQLKNFLISNRFCDFKSAFGVHEACLNSFLVCFFVFISMRFARNWNLPLSHWNIPFDLHGSISEWAGVLTEGHSSIGHFLSKAQVVLLSQGHSLSLCDCRAFWLCNLAHSNCFHNKEMMK